MNIEYSIILLGLIICYPYTGAVVIGVLLGIKFYRECLEKENEVCPNKKVN